MPGARVFSDQVITTVLSRLRSAGPDSRHLGKLAERGPPYDPWRSMWHNIL
jgi:hypothetical protein